jgi:hypothetical protein
MTLAKNVKILSMRSFGELQYIQNDTKCSSLAHIKVKVMVIPNFFTRFFRIIVQEISKFLEWGFSVNKTLFIWDTKSLTPNLIPVLCCVWSFKILLKKIPKFWVWCHLENFNTQTITPNAALFVEISKRKFLSLTLTLLQVLDGYPFFRFWNLKKNP